MEVSPSANKFYPINALSLVSVNAVKLLVTLPIQFRDRVMKDICPVDSNLKLL